MILSLNANAAIDRVMFIDEFRPGEVMRPTRSVLSVGGKSLDSSVVLKTLGVEQQAISFVAGENGKILARLLDEKDIPCHCIWLEGETRISHVIVETSCNRHSHITTSGYSVTEDDCAEFIRQVRRYAPGASWAVIAGSLPGGAPPSFYKMMVEALHEYQVKALIDCANQPAVESLPASPDILKMNQAEFRSTFQVDPVGRSAWIRECRAVMQRCKIRSLVLTCGKDGMLAFTQSGTLHASAPLMKEVNAAGSGDAVSAALAYRFSLGDTWEQALHWAAATSAAVVLTDGTAECNFEDIERIYPLTRVERILD